MFIYGQRLWPVAFRVRIGLGKEEAIRTLEKIAHNGNLTFMLATHY